MAANLRIVFDTSAITKRYRDEAGRDVVQQHLAQAREVFMAAHSKVEVASGLSRDFHNSYTTEAQLARDLEELEKDFSDFTVVPITQHVERLAILALKGNRLRAMDALHIGTALAVDADCFITADKRQAEAARSSGLSTVFVEA